jgi:hypothetical protein
MHARGKYPNSVATRTPPYHPFELTENALRAAMGLPAVNATANRAAGLTPFYEA